MATLILSGIVPPPPPPQGGDGKRRRIDVAATSDTAVASSGSLTVVGVRNLDPNAGINFEDEDDWETGADIKNPVNPEHIAWEVEPARKDAPGRKAYRIGSAKVVQALASEPMLEQALKDYDGEKLMASSRRSQLAHLRW